MCPMVTHTEWHHPAQVPWTPEVVALPGADERCDPEGDGMLWRGPRVKMGVYQGKPAKVSGVPELVRFWSVSRTGPV